MRRGCIVLVALALLVPLGGIAAAPASEPEVLEVLGPWPGDDPEGAAFIAELTARGKFEVAYTASAGSDLIDRVTGDDPPDLIVVPQPSLLRNFAEYFVDLTDFIPDERLRLDYGDYLIDATTVDGAVVGGPIQMAVKTLVWYQPQRFDVRSYQVPHTFDELVALSDQMVANGEIPWCNWIESGFATGWIGTDWIEDLLLGAEGPDVYDQWVAHDVLFRDPRVESAFWRYMQMIDTAGYVFQRPLMLDYMFWWNAVPLGDDECLMHRQAPFFAAAITDFGYDLADFATFRFPSVNSEFDDAMVGAGVYVAALNDSKTVEHAIKYMLSHKWGREVIAPTASTTGWLVPHTRFDDSRYSDDLVRSWLEAAHDALAAGQFRFDASDIMPPEVGAGTFWLGVTELVAGTKTVPEVLADIDASWPAGP